MSEYSPEASNLTRKRARIAEKIERSLGRQESFNLWLEGTSGQAVLVGILAVVLLAAARLAGLVGN